MTTTPLCETTGYALALTAEHGLEFHLQDGRGALLRSPCPLLLVPGVPGVAARLDQVEVTPLPGGARLRCPLGGAHQGWVENTLYAEPHRLVVRARYALDCAHALHRWEVAPAGAELRADTLHAYMGQHPQPGDGRVMDLTAADFSTASHNWTYCTLAPRVLLRRGCLALVLGGTTVHHDYGLVGSIRQGRVEALYLDYGGPAVPHPMPGGGPHDGPRLQLQVTCGLTDAQAHGAFTQAMIADGIVSPKRYRPEDQPWFRPWYCTWGDQMWLAGDRFRQNVSGGRDYQSIKAVLTQDWLLDTARRIRREGLNIGTFIIDDGWQDYRGDWNLVTERIPDMRAVVDELHALGFKIVLWWAPFDLEKDARNITDDTLVSGPSRADTTIFDYSKPGARAWLEAKLRLWFGSEPGNWHLDGLKIDFFMQKIAPGAVRGDAAWRGEEQGFVRLYRLITELAGRYTESPALLCGPWSPHLLPSLTTVFLEERFDTDCSNLYAKAAIRDAFLPGLRVSPHFVYYPAANPDYFRMARHLDAVRQIGVLQAAKMTPEVLAATRQGLA
jgi:hypothetical protein